jgi:hypothetical protein
MDGRFVLSVVSLSMMEPMPSGQWKSSIIQETAKNRLIRPRRFANCPTATGGQ